MPGGRPTKYEPRFCDEVVSIMKTGLSLTAFAGEIGVARSTINEWMGSFPEFSEACKKGQAARVRYLEQTLLDGNAGPYVTARIFALKNADPDEWRDKREVLHAGEVAITTKEQRDAAVAAAMRADG